MLLDPHTVNCRACSWRAVAASETLRGYAAGSECEDELPDLRRCLGLWQENASSDSAKGAKSACPYLVVTCHSPDYRQCIVARVVLVRSVAGGESRLLCRKIVSASSGSDIRRQFGNRIESELMALIKPH